MPEAFLEAFETLYLIWQHLYNLKNVKNTRGRVLILVMLPALTLLQGCFTRFLNCANDTKSCKTSLLFIRLNEIISYHQFYVKIQV